jgi:aryl-alcohol dehydrogenase-like predicted oxidoreductase
VTLKLWAGTAAGKKKENDQNTTHTNNQNQNHSPPTLTPHQTSDTAELYPVPSRAETMNSTELILGRWMAARGNRDKVTIATKVAGVMPGLDRAHVVAGRFDPPKPAVPGGPQPQLNAEQIRQACEASLRRLQTDRIDLFYIHWPARYCPVFGRRRYCPDQERDASSFDEQVAVMGELIKEGKIREWGLSNETTFGVCRMAEAAARLGVRPPAAIQNDVSLTLRAFEGELAEACAPRNFNIGCVCVFFVRC